MMNFLSDTALKEKEDRKQMLLITAASVVITAVIFYAFPQVMAKPDSSEGGVNAMINTVKTIVTILASVMGAIFLIMGLVKLGIAQTEGDGPEQNKAIKMLATAVILEVIAFVVIPSLDLASLIKTD